MSGTRDYQTLNTQSCVSPEVFPKFHKIQEVFLKYLSNKFLTEKNSILKYFISVDNSYGFMCLQIQYLKILWENKALTPNNG